MQYVPEDGVYVYFRYDNNQTVMVVMNTGSDERTIDLDRFEERTGGFARGKNIIDGNTRTLHGKTTIKAKNIWVMELEK